MNKDLIRGKEILQRHENFLKYRIDLRYSYYIKINKINIKYLETKNTAILNELLEIKQFFRYVGDHETTKAIQYQYETLLKNKIYEPLKAVSPEK